MFPLGAPLALTGCARQLLRQSRQHAAAQCFPLVGDRTVIEGDTVEDQSEIEQAGEILLLAQEVGMDTAAQERGKRRLLVACKQEGENGLFCCLVAQQALVDEIDFGGDDAPRFLELVLEFFQIEGGADDRHEIAFLNAADEAGDVPANLRVVPPVEDDLDAGVFEICREPPHPALLARVAPGVANDAGRARCLPRLPAAPSRPPAFLAGRPGAAYGMFQARALTAAQGHLFPSLGQGYFLGAVAAEKKTRPV